MHTKPKLKFTLVVIALSLLLLPGLSLRLCFSLPEVDSVVSGEASFSQPDSTTLSIQASDKAIINYKSFDIQENETVIITLPAVDKQILNRVLGDRASSILGRLSSNGIVILVNERGIFFGPNANIDVAGLIASTRDIANSNFLSSKYVFERLSKDHLDTLLLNQGRLNIQKAGFGVLIAGAIENSGTIVAPLGTISLASGDMVSLEIAGNGLISVAIDKAVANQVYDQEGKPITEQLKNTGTLEAQGGVVLLKAEALPGIFERAINLDGYVKADTLEEKDGLVKIISKGKVKVNAQVSATNIIIGSNEAAPQALEMTQGTLTAKESISIVAGTILANTRSPYLDVYKKTGDLSLLSSKAEQDLITLEGEDFKVTYLKATNLTLQTDNAVNTREGVILQANSFKLIAQRFGTASLPLILEANTTHINRIGGDIEIMESLGLGSSIMLRGPPSGFGAIVYSPHTNLILEAQNGTLYLEKGVSLSLNSLILSSNQRITCFSSIFAKDYIKLLSPQGFITQQGTLITNKDSGLIIFKAKGLNIGGTYVASFLDFDPETDITISSDVAASGNTTYTTDGSIYVNANVTITSGNLVFTADNDNDSFGKFEQLSGTTISTVTTGTITINSAETAILYAITSVDTLTVNNNKFDNGNITVSGNLQAANGITLNANNNLSIAGNITITGASKTAALKADADQSGSGTLSRTSGTFNVQSTGQITLSSAANLTTSDLLTGATLGKLYINTYGNANITVDQSFDLSAIAASIINFYSNGNLTIDTTASAGTYKSGINGSVYLYADNDADGVGSLLKTGSNSITLDATTSGFIILQSSADITTSTWLTGAVMKTLQVYTKGNANILVDQSFDLSAIASSQVNFYSNGNLTIDTTAAAINLKAGTAGWVSLYADNNADGVGSLLKTGSNSITLDTTTSGTIFLQSSADITTSTWLTGAVVKTLQVYTKGNANITVDQSFDLSAIASSQVNFYSNGNLTIDTTTSARTYKSGTNGSVYLYADYNADGVGSLLKTGSNSITLGATTTSGIIILQSSADITTSTWLTGAVMKILYVYTKGNANILVDQSFDLSAIASSQIYFYSNGNLTIDTTAGARTYKSGTNSYVYLYADNDADGVGSLLKTGSNSITLDATTSGTIALQSSADITTSTWLTGAVVKYLSVYTKGNANITVDQSFDLSAIASSQVTFYSNGNLTIDTTAGARTYKSGTTGSVSLYADYNADGVGSLLKTGSNSITLDTATSGSIYLQSSADITTSTWLTGAVVKYLSVYTKGNANILVDQSFDFSALASSRVNFYSNGNLTIDTTAGARTYKSGTNGTVILQADNDADGVGSLLKTGSNSITLDTTTSGTIILQSSADITTSTWLTGAVMKTLQVYTKGNANILVDQSFDLSAIALSRVNFYSNGNLTIDTTAGARTYKSGTSGYVSLYADYNADGVGSLLKTGSNSITLDTTTSGTIFLQSSADITTSTWLTGAVVKYLFVFTKGNANITVDQSIDFSALASSQVNFYSNGNLTIDTTAGARTYKSGTIGSVYLYADYNADGVGSLLKTGSNSITLDTTTSGTITLQSSADITTSTWLTGAVMKSLYVYTKSNANILVDQSFDLSAIASSQVNFYSNGNLTIDTTAGARTYKSGTNGWVSLYADYNSDGTGTLSKTGSNTLTLDATNTGLINLQTAGNLTTSTWLSSAVFGYFNAWASGNLTVDTSMGTATGTITLKADSDSNGTGDLTFSSATVAGGGIITLQGANSFTLSTLFSSVLRSANKSLTITSTAGSITVDRFILMAASANLTLQAAGNISLNENIVTTSGTSIIKADNDSNGVGSLSFGTGKSIGLPAGTYTLTLQGANSFTMSSLFTNVNNLFAGSKTITITSTAGNITVDKDSFLSGVNFNAAGNITVNNSIFNTGNLILQADNDGNGAGSITVAGGLTITCPPVNINLLTLKTAANITTSTLLGYLTGRGGSTMSLTSTGGTLTVDSALSQIGAITLSAAEGINLDANVTSITGNVTLNADNNSDGTGAIVMATGTSLTSSLGQSLSLTASGTSTLKTITPGALTLTGVTSAVFNAGSSITIAAYKALTLSSATLSLAGNNLTLSTGSTFSNTGTLRLQGQETISGLTQDTDSGTWEYVGNADGTVDTHTLKDFGGTDYFNLTINDSNAAKDIFQLSQGLAMDGTLIITSGTLSLNGNNLSDATGGATASRGNIAGTLRLQGIETVFWSANDIDSGTYEYAGRNVSENLNLKDFGATDYYNLSINDTNANKATFTIASGLDIDGAFTLSSGTFNQGTQTFNVAGNFSIVSGATFTKASGAQALTLDGTGSLSDSNASLQDLGAVTIGGSSTVRTLASAIKTTSLSINSGNTFSLAGNNFSFSAATVVTNNGTFRLQGIESLTSVNNLDIDTGTVEYVGRNVSENLNLKDFGATDYYNLRVNDTNTNKATFQASDSLSIAGALTVASGTFNANSNTTTVTGLATVSGGTYQASTAIQTFNGGLTISSGSFTGSSGGVDANGNVSLSSGTLTAPSGSFTVSGNWNVTGGTFNPGSGTLTFDGTTEQTVTTNNQAFNGLTLNNTGTDGTANDDIVISGLLDVNGSFTLTNGQLRLDTNNPDVALAGSVSIGANGIFTKGTGSLTFDGITATTYTDSTTALQNLGTVVVNKTDTLLPLTNNKLTLGSSLKVDTLTIDGTAGSADTLNLGQGGYTLELANVGTTANVLTVNGTLTPGVSTVRYSATNSSGNINVATTKYNSLRFSGPETYILTGHLRSLENRTVTGNLTIDANATLDVDANNNYHIFVVGNWTNQGTFLARQGHVVLEGSGTQEITTGGSGSSFYFLGVKNQVYLPRDNIVDPANPGITSSIVFVDSLYTHTLIVRFAGGTYNIDSAYRGMKKLAFSSGTTHTVTNLFDVSGMSTYLIELSSTNSGTSFTLNAPSSTLSYVFVKDSNATNPMTATRSYNGGNNTNWTFSTITFSGTGNQNQPDRFSSGYWVGQYDSLEVNGTLSLTNAFSVKSVSLASGYTLDLAGKNLTTTGGLTNSGTLKLRGDETISGTVTHASGSTVTYTGTSTYSSLSAGSAYSNLSFNGSGGSWATLTNLTVSSNFTVTSGSFNLGSSNLTTGGDFTVQGSFNAGTGKVIFNDSSKVTHVYGTTFSDLEVTTPGKELQFEAGSTETITGSLTLTGVLGNPITLRSATSGSQWNIDPQGTRSVSYVDIKDSNNISSMVINPTNSIDSGNNINWFPTSSTITQNQVDESLKTSYTSSSHLVRSNNLSWQETDRKKRGLRWLL